MQTIYGKNDIGPAIKGVCVAERVTAER